MDKSNKWEALSMRDRAFLIRQAIKNGITDIGSIKDTWEHRFDGEENQTVEEIPWYQKMLNFLGETASMRRDARTGNVGATIVRDLYDSGNKEKADELSAQILAANLAGMTLATGAAAVPASVAPTTGVEAVNLLHTVNIPMKQKLAQNAINILGSLVGGESINRTSQAFGYEGFGDAAYSTVMPNKTNRTPVDNVLISALDAFNPGYYVGISGIKSTKGLKNTNATKSKKSKLTPDEKFKKALANYTEGADYVFYDPVKLRQRLRKEGVSPELLTDDNLKNLIHNRATSLERISSVPKFAIRQPYGPGYQYNLYYANNNPANVGYIEITPGHVGLTPANRINMVRNSSGWNSKTPVKGVSEAAYNAVINDLGSVVSGENLQSAHITEKVLSKFNNKKVINNRGFWTRDGKLTVGNPVYELTTPTFDVPTGYEDDFSLEAFDDSGHFINNISRGPIYKNGGKTNTVEGSLDYRHKFSGEEDLSQIINSFSNTNTSPSEEYLKKMTESPIPLRSNFEDASHYEQDFYNQKISGLRDITKDVTSGQGYLYNHNLIPQGNIIKAKDKPFYYLVKDDVQSYLPLDMYEVLYNQDPKSYATFRKELPKRDYIGGKTSKITREKTAKLIPGLIDSIVATSKRHNINPEVLYHRISKEGYLDKKAFNYNYEGSLKDQEQYWQNVINQEVNGFMDFGLDDAGTLLKEGKIKLTKPVSWEEIDATNEKGRDVVSVVTPTVWDALEIKAGDLRRRQDIMKKMGFRGKDLDTWTNASYNLGVSHKDLKNRKYIKRNYTIPDYSHFIKK